MARFITALSVRRRATETAVDLTDALQAGHVEAVRPDGPARSPVAFHVAVTPDAPVEILRTAHAEDEPVVLDVELSGVDERQQVTAQVKEIADENDAVDLTFWARPRRSLLERL